MAVETARKFLERLIRYPTTQMQPYFSAPDYMQKLVEFAQDKGYIIDERDLGVAIDSLPANHPVRHLILR